MQEDKILARDPAEFDVVDRPLHRREFGEQRVAVGRGPEQRATRIRRVAVLHDEPPLHQLGGFHGDEGARYAQMVAHRLHGDVALGLEVADRNKDCVLDAREADERSMAVADRLVTRLEGEEGVDKLAELPVVVPGEELLARDRERGMRGTFARRRRPGGFDADVALARAACGHSDLPGRMGCMHNS